MLRLNLMVKDFENGHAFKANISQLVSMFHSDRGIFIRIRQDKIRIFTKYGRLNVLVLIGLSVFNSLIKSFMFFTGIHENIIKSLALN